MSKAYSQKRLKYRRIGNYCYCFILGTWVVHLHPDWYIYVFIAVGAIGAAADITGYCVQKKENKANQVQEQAKQESE